jgi:hypothetical protein
MVNKTLTLPFAVFCLLWLPCCRRGPEPPRPGGLIPGTSTSESELPVPPESWRAITLLEEETKRCCLAGKDAEAAENMEKTLAYFRKSGNRRLAAEKDIELGFHHGNHGSPGKSAEFFLEAFILGMRLKSLEGESIQSRTFAAMQDTALNLVRLGKSDEAGSIYSPLVSFLSGTGGRSGSGLRQPGPLTTSGMSSF